MASPLESIDAMIEELSYPGGFAGKLKSSRQLKSERNLLIRQILKFLENVDGDLTVQEVRYDLEEVDTNG